MSSFCRRRDGYGGFVDEKKNNGKLSINSKTVESEGQCICQRPKQIIFCHSCSHRFQGHLAFKCPRKEHNHVFLMDLDACPKCHGRCLTEICDAPGAKKLDLKAT